MNLRSRIAKPPVRVLLLAAVCALLVAAPVSAVSAGLVDLPTTDVQADGPDEADGANNDVEDGAQNEDGVDEADGANNDVEDGAQNEDGVDEADGANNDVEDGAQNEEGTDDAEGANNDVQDGATDQEGADQQDLPPSED